MTLAEYVVKTLTEQEDQLITLLKRVRKDKQSLGKAEQIKDFVVNLQSLWEEEEGVIVTHPILEEAIKTAEAQFKSANKREDIQARYMVSAVLPSGETCTLPEEFWKKYQSKH